MVPGAGAWGRALPLPEAAAPEHVAGKKLSFLLSCAGRRRGNFLLQFLAVVPNQENFCFPEWPMERNAGHKMFTRFHKLVQTVGDFHDVALQFRRRDENDPFVWSRWP